MSEENMAQRIRDLRLNQGLTLEQVANQVGVGKSTVRKWETGMIANMRRDKIADLAKALHTTPAYLMGWEDDPLDGEEPIFPEPDPVSALLLLPPDEQELISCYRSLDEEGQDKLLDYADDLMSSGKYIKFDSLELGNQA